MTLTKKIHELSKVRFTTNRKSDKKFKTEASRIPEINKRIMEMVNEELKKPRHQRHLPDYADILKIFKEVSKTHPACSTEDAQSKIFFGKTLFLPNRYDLWEQLNVMVFLDSWRCQ